MKKFRRAPVRDAEPMLVWYFCFSEAEICGGKSQHEGFVEMVLHGPQPSAGRSKAITDRQARAVAEARSVERILALLTEGQRKVLRLAYGPQDWPAEVKVQRHYGRWPGVLLMTEAAQGGFLQALGRAVRKSVARARAMERRGVGEWLRTGAAREARMGIEGRALLERAREEAEELVSEAHAAWLDAGGWELTPALPKPPRRAIIAPSPRLGLFPAGLLT